MDGLLQGIDDEGDVSEAPPGCDIGEVADPQHIRRWHPELAVHLVHRARLLLVLDRRSMRLAPDNALNTHDLHQPGNGAAGNVKALAAQLPPDLARPIGLIVLLENAPDLWLQCGVPACPI